MPANELSSTRDEIVQPECRPFQILVRGRGGLPFVCAGGCFDNCGDLLRKGDQGVVTTFDNGLRRIHSVGKKILGTRIEDQVLIEMTNQKGLVCQAALTAGS